MRIQIQGSKGSHSVYFYTTGIPVGSALEEIPLEIEEAIQKIEDYCRTQETPEQKIVIEAEELVQEANNKVEAIVSSFEEWSPDSVWYNPDQVVSYEGKLYRVNKNQGHTSQQNWAPDRAPSLWTDITTKQVAEETNTVPDFEQPTSTNYYGLGDKVNYKGNIYESTLAVNTYSPESYPGGWKLIE